MALAEAADNEKIPDGINLPDEIARREDRLKAIATAKTNIERRAGERFKQEQADYQAKLTNVKRYPSKAASPFAARYLLHL